MDRVYLRISVTNGETSERVEKQAILPYRGDCSNKVNRELVLKAGSELCHEVIESYYLLVDSFDLEVFNKRHASEISKAQEEAEKRNRESQMAFDKERRLLHARISRLNKKLRSLPGSKSKASPKKRRS